MEISFFLSLALTETLHLKKHGYIFIHIFLNETMCYLNNCTSSMCQYLFLINYKEFQSVQRVYECTLRMYREKVLNFEIKNSFFYHLK